MLLVTMPSTALALHCSPLPSGRVHLSCHPTGRPHPPSSAPYGHFLKPICWSYLHTTGLPRCTVVKNLTVIARDARFDLWIRKIPWRRKWQPSAVFWPGKSKERGAWRATVHRVAESDTAQHSTQPEPQWIQLPPSTPGLPPNHFTPSVLIKNLSSVSPPSYYFKSKLKKPKYVTWT